LFAIASALFGVWSQKNFSYAELRRQIGAKISPLKMSGRCGIRQGARIVYE
jgi:hypothetical protein